MSARRFEVGLINRAGGGYGEGNNKTLFTFQKCQAPALLFSSSLSFRLSAKTNKICQRGRSGGEDFEGENGLGRTDTVCTREPAGQDANGRGKNSPESRRNKKKKKMKSWGSRKVQGEKWHEEGRNESGRKADRR